MGLKEKFAAARASAKTFASYGGHIIKSGEYKYLPQGAIRQVAKPLAGAEATYETGNDKSRPTLTRIGAGAIIAGPAGAVVGALFKKDTGKNYVTVVFADGDTVIIEGPQSDAMKMREFAARINAQA